MTRSRLLHNSHDSYLPKRHPDQSAQGWTGSPWLVALAGLICGLLLAGLGRFAAPAGGPLSWDYLIRPQGAERLVRAAQTLLQASLPDSRLDLVINSTPHITAYIEPRSASSMSAETESLPDTIHTVLDNSWSSPENVSASLSRSTYPSVVTGMNGDIHVFWEENGEIMTSVRQSGRWSSPFAVATGQRPSVAVTDDGLVHVVFSNEFADEFDVFYVVLDQDGVWSLPRLVSKTSGLSALPAIAVDQSGVIHAVWADRTPGFDMIYHGWLEDTWLNEPLQNARGAAPAISFDEQRGALHIAWQSQGVGESPLEIFHLEGETYDWSLPENISASADTESFGAVLANDTQGVTHVIWQDRSDAGMLIRYAFGHMGGWSAPETLSETGRDAYAPAAIVTQENQLSVVWQQENHITYRHRSGISEAWRMSKSLIANDSGIDNLSMGSDADGKLFLIWSGWIGASQQDIFLSDHEPVLGNKLFFPLAGG